MNKVPFIVIGIILVTAAFIMIFANNNKNPLEVLDGKATPTPTMIQLNKLDSTKSTPMPTIAQKDLISATKATIHTAKGDIVVELYPNDAPRTVQNFATLAKTGYYNGITFHRVEDWVLQGGDPTGTGTSGESIYGGEFEDELNPETPSYKAGYLEGTLAMANRGPNTNTSQFFILKKDYPLQHNYTIFGKVISGIELVKSMQAGDKMTSIDVN